MLILRRLTAMQEPLEMSARTVEEAIELALKELDVDRDEAEVEVLSRGKAGFLGIGAELARVRVSRLGGGSARGDADAGEQSAASVANAAVGRILEAAGVNVTRTLRSAHDPEAGGPVIDLSGEDSGLLIGRRGQTLQALQFLVTLIVRKKLGEDVRVVLDVENYRQRRENSLRDMAAKVATRVAQTNRSITLEPMPPADRRIIHTSLAEHPGVRTESAGEGENRKVTIIPRRD
ncbi:MAG: protein jag [Chloroflexi bacterium]|nr:protein jag [Chloroflexota bacterium]